MSYYHWRQNYARGRPYRCSFRYMVSTMIIKWIGECGPVKNAHAQDDGSQMGYELLLTMIYCYGARDW